MTPSHSDISSNQICIRTNVVLLYGSLVILAKSALKLTYIRTNFTILNLVELVTPYHCDNSTNISKPWAFGQ